MKKIERKTLILKYTGIQKLNEICKTVKIRKIERKTLILKIQSLWKLNEICNRIINQGKLDRKTQRSFQ